MASFLVLNSQAHPLLVPHFSGANHQNVTNLSSLPLPFAATSVLTVMFINGSCTSLLQHFSSHNIPWTPQKDIHASLPNHIHLTLDDISNSDYILLFLYHIFPCSHHHLSQLCTRYL